MQTAWNIKQLKAALDADLDACRTPHERMTCRAIGGKEIREFAENMSKHRALTPAEIAIASMFGFTAAN